MTVLLSVRSQGDILKNGLHYFLALFPVENCLVYFITIDHYGRYLCFEPYFFSFIIML